MQPARQGPQQFAVQGNKFPTGTKVTQVRDPASTNTIKLTAVEPGDFGEFLQSIEVQASRPIELTQHTFCRFRISTSNC